MSTNTYMPYNNNVIQFKIWSAYVAEANVKALSKSAPC